MDTKTTTVKAESRGSEQVLERWTKTRERFTRDELGQLISLAQRHGGEVVNIAAFGGERDPDDWCGTMWFKGPRPKPLGTLIENLLDRGWNIEIFPRGIINPDMLEVVVRNQIRR